MGRRSIGADPTTAGCSPRPDVRPLCGLLPGAPGHWGLSLDTPAPKRVRRANVSEATPGLSAPEAESPSLPRSPPQVTSSEFPATRAPDPARAPAPSAHAPPRKPRPSPPRKPRPSTRAPPLQCPWQVLRWWGPTVPPGKPQGGATGKGNVFPAKSPARLLQVLLGSLLSPWWREGCRPGRRPSTDTRGPTRSGLHPQCFR